MQDTQPFFSMARERGERKEDFWWQCGMTLVTVMVASLVRWMLNPLLRFEAPFSTFLIAVIFIAWKQDLKQSILASILGFVAAICFFVPANQMDLQLPVTWLSRIGMYFAICGAIAIFGESSRRSQRQLANEMLQRLGNAEILRTTVESIGDALITTDAVGNVTYINKNASKLTGCCEDCKGKPLTAIFQLKKGASDVDDTNPVMEALNTGKTLSLVDHTILLSKDGTQWPLDYSVSPIRNVDDAVVGCVLVFREISKRKKEEEAQAERSRMVSLRADLGTALSSIQDKSQALEHVCSAIVKHLDVVVGTIWVLNDKTLETVASAGLTQQHDESHGGPQLGFSMAHRIVLVGSPLIANSTSDSWQVEDSEWTRRQGIEAFAGYPLLVDGQVIGAMAIFSSKPLPASTLEEMLPLADSIAQFIERKHIEERLRESEEQVRMSLEASSLGTWHVDPKTMTLVTDKRFREIFGRRNERLTYQQAFDCIHPDDQSRVAEAMKASTRVDNPLPYVVEYRVIHPNGTVRWVSAKGRSTYANGQLVSFDGTVSDCTDRKTVEELRSEFESNFRVLVDNIPQLAWIAQPGSDGRIIWFNQNWYEYSGSTLEEMQHTGWHSIIHHEHAERVIRKFRDHVRANMDWEDTFPLRRRDGEYRWFLSRMKVIRNQTGVVQRIFGTNTDVTEQMQLAETLRQSAAELSEADRRKNEFLATLAHELRNPLAPIKNAVQLLGMSQLDTETESLRQTMERQIEQLVRLIDDLLDVSRIGRGKIVLRTEVIDLVNVIDAAVEASSTFVSENKQTLVVHCPPATYFAKVDSARLTQVISNLLNNAAKYSPENCKIELSVSQEQDQILIRVRDNGIGISAEHLEDIFQLFSQVDETMERGSAGLGIGLTLVQTLVELHGGTVTAESQGLGHGSVFTVRLPKSNKDDAMGAKLEDEPLPAFRPHRILVVEDQRALRVVLTRLLEKMGHQVEAVESGSHALELLQHYTPEVVLSDIAMPGMTGYELIRQLRKIDSLRHVHCVAMTGFGQESDKEMAIKSGFDEHMVKPADVKRLYRLFSRLSTKAPQA